MPTILLTGFEPFDGDTLNPSWEAVRQLDQHLLAGHLLIAQQLPCVFDQAIAALTATIDRWQPELVLCVGQAGGRSGLTLERVAINLDDARIPDNIGQQPLDRPVVAGGPAAWFTTLPVKAMVHAAREAGIPAAISYSAGTFVCNHVMYGLLHHLAHHAPTCRGGFLHIPWLPARVVARPEAASMGVELVVRGLEVMLQAALDHQVDIAIRDGRCH